MKENENIKDKRRGLIITAIVHLLLLLVFIFFGLSYMEPKPEKGILINFGNSATGMGDQSDGAVVSAPEPRREQSTQESPSASDNSSMQTQDVVDAPTVNSRPSEKKPSEKPVENKQETEQKPQPSDQLSKLLENVEQSKQGGEGEVKGSGDQGAPDGDKNSPNRSGSGSGGGGDGNYQLGKENRAPLSKPLPDPCPDNNDVGRVVVKIYVDRSGKVINAIPGEKIPGGKASTTTSSCLFSKAKSAAMRTTWQADGDAPTTEVGYIIYNFGKN